MISRASVGKQISKPGKKGRWSNSSKTKGRKNPSGYSLLATSSASQRKKKKARRP